MLYNFIIFLICVAFIINQIFRITIFGINFAVLDAVICAAIILWIIRERSKLKNIFWKDSIGRAWVYFVVSALIALMVNISFLNLSSFLIALTYLVRWCVYSCLFFAVRHLSKEQKTKIPLYLTYCGGIIVVLGYVQYFFYTNLRNIFYLGWDEHMYRLFSVFLDPNFAAAFFVLFIIFLMTELLRALQFKNVKKQIYKKLLLILSIGALLLTFSRSGLVMLIASLFILFMLENRKKMFFILLLGLSIFILSISQFFYIENINLFRTASSKDRITSAQHALRIIEQQPIFGVGFNAYKYAQVRMGYRIENPEIMSHADSGTDNSWLFILATTGIVGTYFYVNLWYKILRSLWGKREDKRNMITTITLVSIIGVFIDSFFINSLFYPSIMLWLFIILGLNDYR